MARRQQADKDPATAEGAEAVETKTEEVKVERKGTKKPKQEFDPNDFKEQVQDLPDRYTKRRDMGKYRAVEGVSYVEYDAYGHKLSDGKAPSTKENTKE